MRDVGDEVDFANELAHRETENRLYLARKLAVPEQEKVDGTWKHVDCIDCGEPIGQARLELGRTRCIECQTALEGRNRFWGKRQR